jgi:hypothetical protein
MFEVEEKTGLIELFAHKSDLHLVVMPVRILALAVVVAEVMARREAGLHCDFKHWCWILFWQQVTSADRTELLGARSTPPFN